MFEKTSLYSLSDIQEALMNKTIIEVYNALEAKGYNAKHQLIGYLISGDSGYITSYNNARDKITEYDRAKILEVILKEYLDRNLWDI